MVIVQEFLPHYRVKFYQVLRSYLHDCGVDLKLCVSNAHSSSEGRGWGVQNVIQGEIEWVELVPGRKLGPFLWQPVMPLCRDADLVIVQQMATYLLNYRLQLRSKIFGKRVAFWGHGKNFQSEKEGGVEKIKRYLLPHVDWWFAYNNLCKDLVVSRGFSAEKTTAVQNSIDTKAQIAEINGYPDGALAEVRAELGMPADAVIAVYTGGLYEHKRIPFLLKAARLIKDRIPHFHLIIIGKGPQEQLVKDVAIVNDWMHFVGGKNDSEKIPYWKMAKVSLMPGAVGLGILDSFVFGVPMVTTDYPYHGPEIDYLDSGSNGLMVRNFDNVQTYVDAIVGFLEDSVLQSKWSKKCIESVCNYSAETMARNFADGIFKCLGVIDESRGSANSGLSDG